jgi:hypothetical protein
MVYLLFVFGRLDGKREGSEKVDGRQWMRVLQWPFANSRRSGGAMKKIGWLILKLSSLRV